ncbi:alanine racemase [Flavobacteriaceae bacterium AU392]|nr:alanine racemase [Flavobacteriaceae bacterium]RKM84758.1 alanine racemase [Flavobacteriaceae bacterium AU392]
MPKAQETVLEIDLKALKHNFEYLKSKLDHNVKFMAVVKAFGYGSNAIEIAKYLEELKVDYFAVAYVNEGITLREAGIITPILILHPQAVNLKSLIKYSLEPSLYNAKILNEFLEVANTEKQNNYPIHIKFNTGLNRLGFWENDCNYLLDKLKDTLAVKVTSIFSHLAASEDLNEKEFTLTQIETYKNIVNHCNKISNDQPLLHMCNTSGILNYPEAHFSMVRSGIGLYGYGNDENESKNLKPIASLKSIISQIHHIEKNETVGYNRAYKSDSFQKTATIPIGHADGISRQFGNENGYVFVNGKQAPIIGNVCMDMIMINITGIDCVEGDEVVLFDKKHTAENLAENLNTISYELLTNVSQRVKRVFYR